MTSTFGTDKAPIVALSALPNGNARTDTSNAIRLSFNDTPPARPRPQLTKKNLFSLPAVALVLPNTGSVARDHLASERTWLSYVRTSLGFATTGVALVQLFTMSTRGDGGIMSPRDAKILLIVRPLGITTVILGLYVLAMGVRRYFRVQHAMTQGEFPVARVTVLGITGVLAALIVVTFGMLLAIPRK